MQDAFWTDELALEFAKEYRFSSSRISVEQFKSSKSPKKEWEIVAYCFEPLKSIDKPVLVTQGSKYWDRAISGDKDFLIHSVRRLSDNLTFRLKEIVETGACNKRSIEKFIINGNQMIVEYEYGSNDIEFIKKLPQPILTTVDGVEKFEGDNYWHINEDWSLSNFNISTEWVRYPKEDKYFSTEQAAKDWIVQNKPLLSLNDVKKVCEHSDQAKALAELTALVKQKLNQ